MVAAGAGGAGGGAAAPHDTAGPVLRSGVAGRSCKGWPSPRCPKHPDGAGHHPDDQEPEPWTQPQRTDPRDPQARLRELLRLCPLAHGLRHRQEPGLRFCQLSRPGDGREVRAPLHRGGARARRGREAVEGGGRRCPGFRPQRGHGALAEDAPRPQEVQQAIGDPPRRGGERGRDGRWRGGGGGGGRRRPTVGRGARSTAPCRTRASRVQV
mmetsp:Transcript_88194/g.234169  ORF Transcript_88194/g.234169 Transcript_88194/m.234169 type:complete len:211 (-) Transcript_88194:153-785(-)